MTDEIAESSVIPSPSRLPTTWTTLPLDDSDWFVPVGVAAFTGRKMYFSTGSIQPSAREPEGEFEFANRPTRANRMGRKWDVLQARMAGANKAVIVDESLNNSLFSTGFMQWRPPVAPETLGPWLFYAVQAPDFLAQRDRLASGTTQVALNDGNLSKMTIPIAPLAEQHRIVEAIETRFARLDAAVRALERAQANLKRYRASVLEHFCWSRRLTSIVNVVDSITDGEHQVPTRSSSGIAFISARNVRDGRIELGEMDYIAKELHEKFARRLRPGEGDVLITCSGTVGRSALVPAGLECSLNRSVAIVRPRRSRIIPAFLMYSLLSPAGQSQISGLKKQTAQANLFQGSIRQLAVPDLDLDEQVQRVAEIERRLSLADEALAEVEHGLRGSIRLRGAILSRAFEGGLVPQDPNDELASVLLERIKREGSLPSQSMTRKRKTARAS